MGRRLSAMFVSLVVAGALCLPQAASAFGYKDTAHDPNDRKAVGEDPDFRSTTRNVWVDGQGRRWLTVALRSYNQMGLFWRAKVWLDARGGPLVDHLMTTGWLDEAGQFCGVRRVGHPHDWRSGTFAETGVDGSGHRATCRVRLHWVQPNKEIRWKVFSQSQTVVGRGSDEYIPNDHTWID